MTTIKMQIEDKEDSLSELRSRVATIAGESSMPCQKKRLPKAISVSASMLPSVYCTELSFPCLPSIIDYGTKGTFVS